jgi:rhamnose utilization protein RhaD (predicted bifunctional aldolase and dehydrogenase)
MSFNDLVEMSNRYGSDEEFVLAGGGNTSFKEDNVLYVKGSGVGLSVIKPEQFVAMDISKLRDMVERVYPESMSNSEREEAALSDMMAARMPGEEAKRPSVESILHAIFPYKLVLHVHPPLINGLTCGVNGKEACVKLFGDKVVWIELTKPGLVLSQVCYKVFNEYTEKHGNHPQIAILQNHGIFVAADTVVEIDRLMDNVVEKIKGKIKEAPDFNDAAYDKELAERLNAIIKGLYSSDDSAVAQFCTNKQVLKFVKDAEAFKPVGKPFSPDHIVYCKDESILMDPSDDVTAKFASYEAKKGYKPKIVAVLGLGFFALGMSDKEASQSRALFLDAVKIATYAQSFGGANPLNDEFTDFILNWEVEAYRIKA